MASEHLGTGVKINWPLMVAGPGFGLGFAVRSERHGAIRGSRGEFFWSGMAGTFFLIDPVEGPVRGIHDAGPRQREYICNWCATVYAAVE